MHVEVFKLRRKSHSLLDDPCKMAEQTLTLITDNPSFTPSIYYNQPNSRSQDAIIFKENIIVTFSHIKT